MKALLISIKPKWVAKILNGKKTIEIRKTAPICKMPIDVYIYCTKSDIKQAREHLTFEELKYLGKVVAKFTLTNIVQFTKEYPSRYIDDYYDDEGYVLDKKFYKKSCLTTEELFNYIGSGTGYAWYIKDLMIFDKPKALYDFHKCFKSWVDKDKGVFHLNTITRAPQSWQFIEVE